MKKDKAQDLVNRAKNYIGRVITMTILDENNSVKKEAMTKFTDWASISMNEKGAEPNIQLYAKMVDTSDNSVYSPSLKSVIEYFEQIEKENNS